MNENEINYEAKVVARYWRRSISKNVTSKVADDFELFLEHCIDYIGTTVLYTNNVGVPDNILKKAATAAGIENLNTTFPINILTFIDQNGYAWAKENTDTPYMINPDL